MKYIVTLCIYALAALPLAAQTDVALTVPDVKGYPVNRVPFRLIVDGSILTNPDVDRLHVYEEGIDLPFTVDCPEQTLQSASIAIGLERSLDANYGIAKEAALNFVQAMQFTEVPNNASYWSFATPIDREVDVVRDSARLWHAINGTDVASFPFNGTPLWETMHRAIEDIVQYGTEPTRAIVFFTDGRNNTSYFSTSREDVITRANTDGVRIYVVAVKSTASDRTALADMCTRTNGIMRTSDDPNAVRDIYEHIVQPSAFDYWCTLEYRSPLCPNGSARNITIQYEFPSTGGIGETVGYTAPFRERDLTKLNFYVSPRRVEFDAGDTLWAAFGVRMDADALVSDMRLDITHPGLIAVGPVEVLEGIDGWNAVLQAALSFTQVSLTPPTDAIADSGSARWFRLMFVAQTSDDIEIQAALAYDKTQCLVLQDENVFPGYRVQLDTVVTEWNSDISMPFRVRGEIPPEGVQWLSAEIALNMEELTLSVSGNTVLSGLPPGWITRRALFTTQASAGVVQVDLSGPPVDDPSQLFALRLHVEDHAGYFNAVPVYSSQVNAFAVEGVTSAGPGLVVIRDSCRNQYSVVQQGLAVCGPAPNPVRSTARYELRASREMGVNISVFNALGIECCAPRFHALPQGRTDIDLPVDMLEDGVYLVRFVSDAGGVTKRMVVGK